MNETLPVRPPRYSLQFEQGWNELARSDRSPAYQDWFAGRVQETQAALLAAPGFPAWALEYHLVAYRWQRAVEFVAVNGMGWDANPATGQDGRVEKAIKKLREHLAEPENWKVPGLSFYLPKRHPLDARSDTVVDILRLPVRRGVGYSIHAIEAVNVPRNPKYL